MQTSEHLPSPVEALQREIGNVQAFIERCDDSGVSFNQWSRDTCVKYLAALELAKADAECAAGVASGKLTINMVDARHAARAKLYEAFQ